MGKSTVLCALIRMRKILRFRCVSIFECAFARVFVFLQHLSFTGKSRVLGDYPASKNTEQINSEVISSYIALVHTSVEMIAWL